MRAHLLLGLLAISALACPAGPGMGDPPTPGDDDDSAAVEAVIHGVEVEGVGFMPTVLAVRWQTSRPAEGRVCFWEEGQAERATPWIGGDLLAHETLLVGLRPGREVGIRVEARGNGETWTEDVPPVTTGTFPPQLPGLESTAADGGLAAGGFTITSLIGGDSDWVVILDPAGEIVWAVEGLQPGFRTVLARDRQSIWTNSWIADLTAPGWLKQVALTGELVREIEVPSAHTDFVERDDGTLAVLAREVREFDDGARRVVGDTIVEIAPDGAVTEWWNLFDHVPVDLDVAWPDGFFEDDAGAEDWSHCNGLEHDPVRGAYLLSCAHHDAIYAIDDTTGELLWTLSAWQDDFSTPSEQMPIVAGPHAVEGLGADTILVFNRGDVLGHGDWPEDLCSQAVEIRVDTAAGEATAIWSHASDECFMVYCLGDAQRLWNGNTLINWSTAGQLDEVTADGEVVWRVNSEFGWGFGFSTRVDDLY